ncbi:unnamed protein product [Clonostachys rosea f. rosea IK726]|uniref:Uncharacterized protein n=1 Tax=Clonostachys rosea f. rosea IK726 TaxID=1349383 RepID=A0ACA9T865_BIOOC|nr:unnamed protein product [Clonostachys rosea f. rosea IK726]
MVALERPPAVLVVELFPDVGPEHGEECTLGLQSLAQASHHGAGMTLAPEGGICEDAGHAVGDDLIDLAVGSPHKRALPERLARRQDVA